ncbi:MAG: cobalamin biosynthesis protein [Chloroflexi bacterium]|nr:cobalamin biosynthesis protein [Chloroflexota bacterium]
MYFLFIFLLAVVIDLTLGEPPHLIHPVVWMGKVISLLIKDGGGRSPAIQFFYGLVVVVVTVGIFTIPVYLLLFYLRNHSPLAYIVLAAIILKTTFSIKELRNSALKVRDYLAADKLTEARFELRSLAGRNTSQLDKSLIVSATVESVAENSCDSFVAPLFYFLFFGVPGAVVYRAINTLDSMIGHRGEFEYLGKFAARLDSIVNFIPARITALVIVLAARIQGKNASGAWQIMWRDRSRTASPNAGWTMSAIAGALDVQLEKVGYYKLGDNHNSLSVSTIDASLQIVMTAALIWSLLLVITGVIYYVTT